METTVKQRIEEFIRIKGLKPATFERICGLSNAYLTQLKKTPSLSKIDQICNAFPEINREWLITGQGEMFSEQNDQKKSSSESNQSSELVEALRSHISDLQAERDRLLDEREEMKAEIDRLRRSLGIEPMKKETA